MEVGALVQTCLQGVRGWDKVRCNRAGGTLERLALGQQPHYSDRLVGHVEDVSVVVIAPQVVDAQPNHLHPLKGVRVLSV